MKPGLNRPLSEFRVFIEFDWTIVVEIKIKKNTIEWN